MQTNNNTSKTSIITLKAMGNISKHTPNIIQSLLECQITWAYSTRSQISISKIELFLNKDNMKKIEELRLEVWYHGETLRFIKLGNKMKILLNLTLDLFMPLIRINKV